MEALDFRLRGNDGARMSGGAMDVKLLSVGRCSATCRGGPLQEPQRCVACDGLKVGVRR